MHIEEGALSTTAAGTIVLGAGWVLAAAGTAWALRKLDYERIPQVAMLSTAFFVASLLHVPIGPVDVHLVLNGLVGLILGWAAFPAILVALFLQAVLFGYGGLTTLGINTLTMAIPAVACYAMFGRAVRNGSLRQAFWWGNAAGGLSIVLSAMLMAAWLLIASSQFRGFAAAGLLAQLVVAAIEAEITGIVVAFLRKVRPELLAWPGAAAEA